VTIATMAATVAAGLFAGASLYVSVVQHPAWLECGSELAIKEFGPSTRRAAVLQGGFAVIGLVSGAVARLQGSGVGWLAGGILLGSLVPFTLVILIPINRRLLDPQLDPGSPEASELLVRWGRLHAVRTVVGVAAFAAFVGLSLQP
jgi:uncharacterized membrane protein